MLAVQFIPLFSHNDNINQYYTLTLGFDFVPYSDTSITKYKWGLRS